ncbi:NADH dehydrogenase subunit J [Tibeticola sediminis]|uniref:NADH-quinone oxidoreductase subunit J n=1 Tax=Tibeticola sediminis TaxID=1917811 RepID=A0A3N4VG19_9BURK|nr:NADH-quinone oxidoreductase subunit J [Tibeticola sediminis]RPE72850.1 NADH dehydrogenase subunit J [Tibeticola sediminis]
MDVPSGFFYLFSAVLLFAALRVITAKNPVHAVLYLMLAFSQAAGVWLLLEAEFLAITLVLVYLGAVMVLFLFVVMMLDIRVDRVRGAFWRHFPLAAGLGALVAAEMAAVLLTGYGSVTMPAALAPAWAQIPNTQALGRLLYTEYLYPLQVAAVILVVAMVAAIALTLRRRKDSKFIDPSLQVHVRAADRVRLVRDVLPGVAPVAGATAVDRGEAK